MRGKAKTMIVPILTMTSILKSATIEESDINEGLPVELVYRDKILGARNLLVMTTTTTIQTATTTAITTVGFEEGYEMEEIVAIVVAAVEA